MLISATSLLGYPVLSLHVSGTIAHVTEIIVDPNDLKIIAFRVDGPMVTSETGDILPVESIREFSQIGMIVDSGDEFVNGEEIVRIKTVLGFHFVLIGLKVESKAGNKLGKVSSYNVEPTTWVIQQLVVQRPLIKSLLDPELLISRTEIDSVTNYKVIIKEEKSSVAQKAVADTPSPSFTNPFRERKFATSESHTEDQHSQSRHSTTDD